MRDGSLFTSPEAGQRLEMAYREDYRNQTLDQLVGTLCCFQGYASTAKELYENSYFNPHCAQEWSENISASAAYHVFCEKYADLKNDVVVTNTTSAAK